MKMKFWVKEVDPTPSESAPALDEIIKNAINPCHAE